MGKQLRDALRAVGLGLPKNGKPSAAKVAGTIAPGQKANQAGNSTNGRERGQCPKTDAGSNPAASMAGKRIPGRQLQCVVSGACETGGSPQSRAGRVHEPSPSPPAPVCRLIRTGPFQPHPLFVETAQDRCSLHDFPNAGVVRQLTDSPDNETDLVIGLDFGTSATKMVIRDPYAAMGVFAVRLNDAQPGIDGCLLPTRVFRTGNVYSLKDGDVRIDNLKLGLMEAAESGGLAEFNDCCAFLALVIRRAKGWFFSEHRQLYSGHQLNWRVNLGLAARSYENRHLVDLFRRLAWAAANLAADQNVGQITTEAVTRYRQLSLRVLSEVPDHAGQEFAFGWADVDVVPEVSAQLQGFMASAHWDWSSRPVMMLVDVGAGTVDSAVFHVNLPKDASGTLTFYSSRVEHNGVMNLHRERIEWLQRLIPEGEEHSSARNHLAAIAMPTDRLRPIPEMVRQYLQGYELVTVSEDVDSLFRRKRYRAQVVGSIRDAKVGKGIRTTQLQRVPLLLCGGGARMEFYYGIVDAINHIQGWHVSVERVRLPVPGDLAEAGWHASDFDRISVAYGLSLTGDGGKTLGAIVRAIDVPDANPDQIVQTPDLFVSKDLV